MKSRSDRTPRQAALLIFLVLLTLGSNPAPAQADKTAQAPAAPRDELRVTGISPRPPAVLKPGEKLYVDIAYTLASEDKCQIWARPMQGKRSAPGYRAHGSPVHPRGSGNIQGYFFFDVPTRIDRIRVYMKGDAGTLAEIVVDVNARWEGPAIERPRKPDRQPSSNEKTAILAAATPKQPAPPLRIAHWVKGKPVNIRDGKGDRVYVVEFWATWCGPCKTSIPHLTDLQRKFRDKGVTIVSISSEDPQPVSRFVQQMGDGMDFTVAIDRGRATYSAYMDAYRVRGIPHAFVVGKSGDITWHGHPMSGLDKAVEAAVGAGADSAKPAAPAILTVPTKTRPGEKVDQANTPPWSGERGLLKPDRHVSQTFRPALPVLTAVDIALMTGNAKVADQDTVTLTILKDGRKLASVSKTVPRYYEVYEGLLRFDLPDPLTVVPGQTYTIEAATPTTLFLWLYADDNYDRGERVYAGRPRSNQDFIFRTYGTSAESGR